VIARSLRQFDSRDDYDLILMHTGLESSECELLARSFDRLVLVDAIRADEAWLNPEIYLKFRDIFTKLHLLSLVEYEKVLMLDADLVAQGSITTLFSLPAPAAFMEPPNETVFTLSDTLEYKELTYGPYETEEDVTKAFWKVVREDETYAFKRFPFTPPTQQGFRYFNAGVVLLRPDVDELQSIIATISAPPTETTKQFVWSDILREVGPLDTPEQEFLSARYSGQICHIPIWYNGMVSKYDETVHSKYVIFHFAGIEKPWEVDGERQQYGLPYQVWWKAEQLLHE
jgi:lipopolysaccharide biosynthesis glycosyltransferase